MKKLTALLLSVVLVLSLAACGSANKPASSTTQPETSAPTEQPTTEPSESSSTAPAESEHAEGVEIAHGFSASMKNTWGVDAFNMGFVIDLSYSKATGTVYTTTESSGASGTAPQNRCRRH